jgi:hypothetical protein
MGSLSAVCYVSAYTTPSHILEQRSSGYNLIKYSASARMEQSSPGVDAADRDGLDLGRTASAVRLAAALNNLFH